MAASWEDFSFAAATRLRLDTFASNGESFLDLDGPVSPLLSPPASPRSHHRTPPTSAAAGDRAVIESPLPRQADTSYFAQYGTQNRISKQYASPRSRCDRYSPTHSPRSGTPVSRTGPSPPSSPRSSRPSSPFSSSESTTPTESRTSYQTHSASAIRAQRQRGVRAQCSSAHLKEVSALVARMVQTGDQCNVASPPETARAAEATYPSPRSEVVDLDDEMADVDPPRSPTTNDEGFVEGTVETGGDGCDDDDDDDDLAEATMRLRLQYRRSVDWGGWNPGAGERASTPQDADAERRRSSGFAKRDSRVRKYSSPTVRRR